jgi:hypothetical protein
MTFEKTNGSRAEVWHGTAKKTLGGLTKSDLLKNKHGRIVSRRKHASGKRSIKHLEKLGYKAKKGHFTLFRKGHKGSRKMRGGTGAPMGMGMQGTPTGNAMAGIAQPMPMMGQGKMKGGNGMMMKKGMMGGYDKMGMMGGKKYSRKMRGGMAYGGPLSPHSYDGKGVGTSGAGLQIMATTMN